jgi:cytidine deaminase
VIPDHEWAMLEQASRQVSEKAYCPYSQFRVGAALLSSDGRRFTGCNVENQSYGLTVCAERNAVFNAVASGVTEISAIVIYTPTAASTAPCGACREVLAQFGIEAIVRSICDGDVVSQWTVSELLPSRFLLNAPTFPDKKRSYHSNRPRLCIDVDNVVTQTDAVLRRVICDFKSGTVNLSYTDIVRFDYHECIDSAGLGITKEEWNDVHLDWFPRTEYQKQIQPIDGAISSIRQLSSGTRRNKEEQGGTRGTRGHSIFPTIAILQSR